MPVKECELDGKSGYKWGDEGKCYTYYPNNESSRRTAKKSALIQGLAIENFIKLDITCEKCGWVWNTSDGGNDPYVCHKCGYDNK